MTKRYITTDTKDEFGGHAEGEAFPVDTDEEIAAAREALRNAGLDRATIYVGCPDGLGDAYASGAILFV